MPVIKKKAVKTAKKKAVKKTTAKKIIRKKPVRKPLVPPTEKRIEQKIVESKFYTGPIIQKFEEAKPFELLAGYGDNRIVLMVRDPFWLYAYWEINGRRREEIKKELGAAFAGAREILRVYDTESWHSFDIELSGGATNWYFRVPAPNRTYCADIGFLTADGRFIAAARSNWVTTPLDRMSDVIDEQWIIPDWERMYALSGGFGLGRSSEQIREMMKRRLEQEAASGWVSSISSPVRKMGERPFWLVANCELIVYGATEPTASVTVQGHRVKLREDGTFSLRFLLPDGKQVIPIEAIRDDGAQRRRIIPIVERQTD